MSKNDKTIRKLKEENRQLREQNTDIEGRNSLLESENKILRHEKQKISQQLNNYRNADKNQLTSKEDFKISIPILVVLVGFSIAITYCSYKNETNTLGYKLAIFLF